MLRHKLLIRHFPEGLCTGKSTRHFDEVQILERSGGDAFIYSQTQTLFIPRYVESPIPIWGFILDNSTSVQRTYPVLAALLESDSVKEQLEKFQALDLIMIRIFNGVLPVKGKDVEEGRCESSLVSSLAAEATSASAVHDGRPEPWRFDHWSCANR
jgi:hypothetical protein